MNREEEDEEEEFSTNHNSFNKEAYKVVISSRVEFSLYLRTIATGRGFAVALIYLYLSLSLSLFLSLSFFSL